jgi:hypothetical protein
VIAIYIIELTEIIFNTFYNFRYDLYIKNIKFSKDDFKLLLLASQFTPGTFYFAKKLTTFNIIGLLPFSILSISN